jgi:hypothetical protein
LHTIGVDIFQALRVRKTEQTIRWHDFIAAGLSQCKVDDRNLRLAFDRLDTGGKGFITLEDFMELMGTAEEVKAIWTDTVGEEDSRRDRITYEDFLLLMKGQPLDVPGRGGASQRSCGFEAIPEGEEALTEDQMELLDSSSQSFRRAYKSMRSRSMDETHSPKRARLQRRGSIQDIIAGDSQAPQTPLVVHKQIYRAHREMRLAVLEASKRFEESRAKRQQTEHGVALPMRRISLDNLSSEKTIPSSDLQHQKVLTASQRGGRTRRVKTVSDVSGFF